ncbi:hypothetical protein R80B4_02329 [Fibrobacteres bacterium R8-0-B4]
MYNPDVIAVHTTCLSETIGDDLTSFIMDLELPEGKLVVHTNTPSYVGSHINGYFNMMIGFMNYLTKKTGKPTGKTAVFPGWVNPGDIRELKRIAALMNVPTVFFPDQSGVLDAPMTGRYEFYPEGGTTLDEIRSLGDSGGLARAGKPRDPPRRVAQQEVQSTVHASAASGWRRVHRPIRSRAAQAIAHGSPRRA